MQFFQKPELDFLSSYDIFLDAAEHGLQRAL
jgi:hypothetical protein